jgi:hypothetical protein
MRQKSTANRIRQRLRRILPQKMTHDRLYLIFFEPDIWHEMNKLSERDNLTASELAFTRVAIIKDAIKRLQPHDIAIQPSRLGHLREHAPHEGGIAIGAPRLQ